MLFAAQLRWKEGGYHGPPFELLVVQVRCSPDGTPAVSVAFFSFVQLVVAHLQVKRLKAEPRWQRPVWVPKLATPMQEQPYEPCFCCHCISQTRGTIKAHSHVVLNHRGTAKGCATGSWA